MHSTSFWSLHFLFAVAFLPFGSAIQCYFCSTETDSRCPYPTQYYSQSITGEPSDCTQTAVDATLGMIRSKIPSSGGEQGNYDCIKAEVMKNRNITIVRGCAQAQTRKYDPCVDLRNQFTDPGELVHCSICKTDGCNGSSHTYEFGLATLILASITLFFN